MLQLMHNQADICRTTGSKVCNVERSRGNRDNAMLTVYVSMCMYVNRITQNVVVTGRISMKFSGTIIFGDKKDIRSIGSNPDRHPDGLIRITSRREVLLSALVSEIGSILNSATHASPFPGHVSLTFDPSDGQNHSYTSLPQNHLVCTS